MKKLPAIFKIYFKKEGVVHELRRLAALTPGAPTPPPAQHATPSPSPQSPASSTPTREPTRRLADLMRRLKDKTSGSETSSEQPAQPEFVPASPRTPKAGSQSKGGFRLFRPSCYSGFHFPLSLFQDTEDLRTWVIQESRTFCETYFPENGGSSSSADTSPTMKKLKDLSEVFANPSSSPEALFQALAALSKLFSDNAEGVSAFELMSCEIIPGLNTFLTSTTATVPRDQRLRMFVRVFLDGPKTEVEAKVQGYAHAASNVPLSFMVKRLHEAFTKLEQLPILIHEVVGGDSRGALSGLKVLAQPFKLRLQKLETETSQAVKDYGENVVMIEPLATIQAIENFLLPKVSDPTQKPKAKTEPSVDETALLRRRTNSSKPRNDSEVQDISLTVEGLPFHLPLRMFRFLTLLLFFRVRH